MMPEGRALRILLVEDHADSLMAQAMLLRKRGYEVSTAASAEAALALASSSEVDLVVADLGLPGKSGLELMVELKSSYALRGIALTGLGEERDLARSVEAGFVKHLVKPVQPDELQEAIREVCAAGSSEGRGG